MTDTQIHDGRSLTGRAVVNGAASVSAVPASAPIADIIAGDDGMSVFWPDGCHGGFSAHHLRAIADEMDRRDAPLVKSMNRYLRAQRICDSDRVLSVFAAPEWSELGDDGKEWILAIIDEVDAQGIEARQGQDAQRLDRVSDESPVAESHAPNAQQQTEGLGASGEQP